MMTAARIFANPDAHVSRATSLGRARTIGSAYPRGKAAAIFHGPTPGEFWVAQRGVVSTLLAEAGLERAELA